MDQPPALSASAFAESTGVSRETLDRLRHYLTLLASWQVRINLVGAATLQDPWRRHILDSAQLVPLIDAAFPGAAPRIADLGSGAGFPGMVLAMLGAGEVHLIESNRKKAAFLKTVARETATRVAIHAVRSETLAGLGAQVVTARAVAPLAQLLDLARPLAAPDAIGLFLKGRRVGEELTAIPEAQRLAIDRLPSESDPDGCIVRVARFRQREGDG